MTIQHEKCHGGNRALSLERALDPEGLREVRVGFPGEGMMGLRGGL